MSAVVVATKRCSRCRETKPLTEFHRNRAKTDGRRGECKVCANAMVAAYQERKRAEMGEDAWREMNRSKVNASRARNGLSRDRLYNRARSAAAEALIRAHRSEFDRLLAAFLYEEERKVEDAA